MAGTDVVNERSLEESISMLNRLHDTIQSVETAIRKKVRQFIVHSIMKFYGDCCERVKMQA